MTIILLDSNPLSFLTYSKKNYEVRRKIQKLIEHDIVVAIPEIIDYELRRTLICGNRDKSIENLDRLDELGLLYAPLTSEIMRKAAELWAWARKTGQQTAHNERIDIDVILASQSIVLQEELGEYVIIATVDINDLRRYCIDAQKWEDITLDYCLNPNPQKFKLTSGKVV